MPKNVLYGGGEHVRWCQRVWGSAFGVWLLAECPKGSNSSYIGFDNRLSRSSTLVDLQDVSTILARSPYILRFTAKSQTQWGCKNIESRCVYRNSKHRVGG